MVDESLFKPERVAPDHVSIEISKRQIDRRHPDAPQIDVLPDKFPMRFQVCDREQHPPGSATRIANGFLARTVILSDRHRGHHLADWLWSEKLPRLTIGDPSLEHVPENIFASLLHHVHERSERMRYGVAPTLSRLAFGVPFHRVHVFVFHLPPGERAHAHMEKVLERLRVGDLAEWLRQTLHDVLDHRRAHVIVRQRLSCRVAVRACGERQVELTVASFAWRGQGHTVHKYVNGLMRKPIPCQPTQVLAKLIDDVCEDRNILRQLIDRLLQAVGGSFRGCR